MMLAKISDFFSARAIRDDRDARRKGGLGSAINGLRRWAFDHMEFVRIVSRSQ